MTNLTIGFASLVVVSCVLIFSPLFRRPKGSADRDVLNKQIFRERIGELEESVVDGGEARYVSGLTTDLQKSLVADVPVASSESVEAPVRNSVFSKVLLAASMVLLPLMAFGLYFKTGNYQVVNDWEGLKAEVTGAGSNFSNPDDEEAQARLKDKTIAEVVSVLQASLQQGNETVEGWRMLATTFARTENFESALYAMKRGLDMDPKDINSLLTYAQILIAINGGTLTAESKVILDQVFLQEANNATAFSLLGMAHFNARAYPEAITNWEKLLNVGGENEQMVAIIERSISVAKERMADPHSQSPRQTGSQSQSSLPSRHPAIAAASESDSVNSAQDRSLDVVVNIDAKLEGLLSPSDTLFVFAKAVSGPPMPLAVFRSGLGAFPVNVHLDDSMAMMPQLKMSKFDQVNVVARVSKHGSVSAETGDLEGRIESVKLGGSDTLMLVIDRVLP